MGSDFFQRRLVRIIVIWKCVDKEGNQRGGEEIFTTELGILPGIEPDKDYDFYVHEMEGKKYLCICTGDAELKKAMNKVRSAGLKVGK